MVTYRIATPDDAAALLDIYSHYVKNTAITFEYTVPSVAEFKERIENYLKKYPYIIAEVDGNAAGYAYASPFQARAAYSWSAQTSIYVSPDYKGMGIGRRLYEILEEIVKKQNILNLYACIAYIENEDEYLTHGSIAFHDRLGYTQKGLYTQCGYKFNRWYDMVWMEKLLGSHLPDTPAVIPFPKLKISISPEGKLSSYAFQGQKEE